MVETKLCLAWQASKRGGGEDRGREGVLTKKGKASERGMKARWTG